jgi:predicted HAD superfamily Cof-like phosphohydrolase
MVEAFHRLLDIGTIDYRMPAIRSGLLRISLLMEEVAELAAAVAASDIEAAADALADITYVTLGTAVEFGIDLEPIFDEVHRSNIAKAGGKKSASGKVQKPDGWKPPDIAGVLERQRGAL